MKSSLPIRYKAVSVNTMLRTLFFLFQPGSTDQNRLVPDQDRKNLRNGLTRENILSETFSSKTELTTSTEFYMVKLHSKCVWPLDSISPTVISPTLYEKFSKNGSIFEGHGGVNLRTILRSKEWTSQSIKSFPKTRGLSTGTQISMQKWHQFISF